MSSFTADQFPSSPHFQFPPLKKVPPAPLSQYFLHNFTTQTPVHTQPLKDILSILYLIPNENQQVDNP